MRVRFRTRALVVVILVLSITLPASAWNAPTRATKPAAEIASKSEPSGGGGLVLGLPETQLIERSDGQLGLRTRINYGFEPGSMRIISFLDRKNRSYRVFVLEDLATDIRRVHEYLTGRGLTVSIDAISDYMTAQERRDRETAIAQERMRHKPGIARPTRSLLQESDVDELLPLDLGRDWMCSGNMWAKSETWEPARYFFDVDELTETYVDAWVFADQGGAGGYPNDGYCWSNPNTFAFTTWITANCFGGYYLGYHQIEFVQTGEYYNYDFASDELNRPGIVRGRIM